ncbi:hypothetical protein BJ165DRAFT_1404036 [Panaeolus papilionaceus]|nr:hypothetical protein BJ165DRAFT_1404036 [Panaeolus papilionaceus]
MGSSVDPASLRAAALSTLKKKAKRPVKHVPDLKSTLTRPPPPSSDSFLLDYGQDESTQDVSMSSTLPENTPDIPSVSAKDYAPTTGDVAMREEGEISEEEEPPPARVKSITGTHLRAPSAPLEPVAVIHSSSTVVRSRSPENQPTSPVSLIDRIFPAMSKERQLKQPENFPMNVDQPTEVAMNFIRPGVALSQEDYDTVKDIILDLLGWGVPPTAIMESGVSREVMFYVFNELNLWLPEGFDYSGIPPYTPAILVQPMQAMEPSTSGHSSTSSFFQPSETRLPAEVTPAGDANFSLLDMEQQRRKELLARKAAVLASRKSKRSSAPPRTPSTVDIAQAPSLQVDPSPTPIASEVVEDFLNSIGPSHNNNEPETGIIVPPPPIKGDESDLMDVDPKNECSTHDVAKQHLNSMRSPSEEPHDLVSIADEPFIEPPPTSIGPPPWSGDSTITTFSDVSYGPFTTTAKSSTRRGTKRPVASDFVDMEPTRYRGESTLDRRVQKLPRFTNLQSMRCVIDLSDDSDSDDERHTPLPSQPGTPMPFEPRAAATRDRSTKRNGQTTQAPAATSILHLKELEIQRMREMIARKEEQTRLKKLARVKHLWRGVLLEHLLLLRPRYLQNLMATFQVNNHNHKTNLRVTHTKTPQSLPQVTPAEEHLEHEVSVHSEVDYVDVEQNQLASAQGISMLPSDHPKPDEKEAAYSEHDSQDTQIFSEYRSPFALYPRLSRRGMDAVYSASSHSSPQTSTLSLYPSTKFSVSTSTISLSSLELDLQPLKFSAMSRSIDPLKRLCQYEIPGPGICRDKGCEDIHLSKLETMEPDDNETADYVFRHLPHDWAKKHQVKSASAIFQALQAVRQKNSEVASLDERVDQALQSIGSLSAT